MADRVLTWFVENVTGDGVEVGPAYYMDQSFTPTALRVLAKRAPDKAGGMTIDILDDGVTILSRSARLSEGDASEPDAEEFPRNPASIEEGSVVTLNITPGSGASGITVHLELTADNE